MIVVAGETLIDLILLADGGSSERPGGGPFNAARTLGRLGAPVAFLGGLSVDPSGDELRTLLESDGVLPLSQGGIRRPTGVAIARLDDGGSATYQFTIENSSSLMIPSADIAAMDGIEVDAFHIGSLCAVMSPAAPRLVNVVNSLSPSVLVMLDPNCRPVVVPDRDQYLAALRPFVERADIVKISAEDVEFMFPGVEADVALAAMCPRSDCLLVLTDGSRPVRVRYGDSTMSIETPPAVVVDTVGAGDSFGAALLAWWHGNGLGRRALSNLGLVASAVSAANEVAAFVCGRAGADPPVRADLTHDWSFLVGRG